MIKENIHVFVNKDLGSAEFDSVNRLVKEYFKLWLNYRINSFEYICYRGYELIINDEKGCTDAIEIEEDLIRQIQKIHSKDGE